MVKNVFVNVSEEKVMLWIPGDGEINYPLIEKTADLAFAQDKKMSKLQGYHGNLVIALS